MKAPSIPNFISSRTPDDLRGEMLQVMVKFQMKIEFFDIQFAQGRWYAWYQVPLAWERTNG